jgi:uncharacterized protein (DUF486 family)
VLSLRHAAGQIISYIEMCQAWSVSFTLSVFSIFSIAYLGERFRWNYALGFACIVLGAFFVFHKW